MLWCKRTFQSHFAEDECRLFPTQRHLFDFLDRPDTIHSGRGWLPFSIELLSEREVAETLSRHTLGASSSGGRGSSIFRRVTPNLHAAAAPSTTEERAETTGQKRVRPSLRQDYSLIYGEVVLSTQNRMFLACTTKGLQRILETIEPRQLHLYEIIREGTPCHLYFDVEREGNVRGLQSEIVLSSSSSSSDISDIEIGGEGITVDRSPRPGEAATVDGERAVVVATVTGRHGSQTYRNTVSAYRELLSRVSAVPEYTCPLDCNVDPDNSATEQALLEALDTFIRQQFPYMVTQPVSLTPGSKTIESRLRDWATRIVIMDSVPLMGPTNSKSSSMKGSKFSQHYVLQLRSHVFESNSSVGEFVRQFVEYLQQRCARGETLTHRALFFHSDFVMENVLTSIDDAHPSPAVPFMVRKCVIDTAVYSRNRMMRCLGSCKLHKSQVLRVTRWLGAGGPDGEEERGLRPGPIPAPPVSLFLGSLISTTVTHCPSRSILRLESGGPAGTSFGNAYAGGAQQPLSEDAITSIAVDASIATRLEFAYRYISGCDACGIGAAKRVGGKFDVYQVTGTRFCQNVQREHKSNGVYLVVDTEKNTWVQKCFDPDCGGFRSHPQPL